MLLYNRLVDTALPVCTFIVLAYWLPEKWGDFKGWSPRGSLTGS